MSMNEVIYLEPDEDITGVIAKVKDCHADAVSLVIPRGDSIAQSIVNLKLLKREIEKQDKVVSLITKDKISKNLASQVGVTVYPSVSEAKNFRADHQPREEQETQEKPDGFKTTGIKINQYTREEPEDNEADTELEPQSDNDEEAAVGASGETGAVEAYENHHESNLESDQDEPEESDLSRERHNLAHAQPVPRQKVEKESEEKSPVTKHNVSSRRKPALIIASVFLILIILAGGVFYPSAEAKVTLATSDIEDKSDLTADKSIEASNLDTLSIPAKEYSLEKTLEKQFATTGSKDVGSKASGEFTFYNDYDPINPVSLANGTVLSASGKTFILDGAITIPTATIISLYPLKTSAGQIKGKVIAKENGEAYNVAPGKFLVSSFSGVKQEKVYGQSTAALTGGLTKNLKVVAQTDIDKAKVALSDEMATAAKDELSKKGDEDKLKLVVSSIKSSELESSSSKQVGEEAENITVKLKLRITELAYSEEALRNLVKDKISKGLKENEMLVNPVDTDLKYDISKVDTDTGKISIKSTYTGKVGKKFEAAKIQELLARSKYGNAESRLEAMDGVKSASVVIKPNFWPFMPFLKQRIKVSFDYQKD